MAENILEFKKFFEIFKKEYMRMRKSDYSENYGTGASNEDKIFIKQMKKFLDDIKITNTSPHHFRIVEFITMYNGMRDDVPDWIFYLLMRNYTGGLIGFDKIKFSVESDDNGGPIEGWEN
jgi:hypothetical protein